MKELLLLLVLVPQDPPITSLLDRWRAEDFSEREKASEELLSRWKEWKEADLALLEKATAGSDREVAERARDVLKRLRVRLSAGAAIVDLTPDFDLIALEGTPSRRLFLLSAGALRWRRRQIADDAAARLATFAKDWTLPDRDILWIVSRHGVTPWAGMIVPMLKSEHPGVRRDAALTLALIGARDHAPAILALLSDEDWSVRVGAAGALVHLKAEALLPDVETLLASNDSGLRRAAASAAVALGGSKEKVLPLLEDADPLVRIAAVRALGAVALQDVRKRLRDASPDVRVAVVDVGQLDLDALHPLLKDPVGKVRTAAAKATGRHRARESVPLLLPLLRDRDGPARSAAADALAACGRLDVWKELVPLLGDEDWFVRALAGDAIVAVNARDAAPALRTLLAHADSGVRCTTLNTLHALLGPGAVSDGAPLLKDAEPDVRSLAVDLLAADGSAEYGAGIAALLRDKDERVRSHSVVALRSVRVADAAALLLPLLKDEEAATRAEVLDSLAIVGSAAIVEQILPVLKDPAHSVRLAALRAIARLGGDAKHLLPFIADADALTIDAFVHRATPEQIQALPLETASALRVVGSAGARRRIAAVVSLLDQDHLRPDAIEALGWLGAVEHADRIARLALDSDAAVRAVSVTALGRMGSSRHESLLAVLLHDPYAFVRRSAALAIGELGLRTGAAELLLALDDPDPAVAREAIDALDRIGARAAAPEIARRLTDPALARMALRALAGLGARDQRDAIRPLLKTDPSYAAWILAELGEPATGLALPTRRFERVAARAALLRSGTLDAVGRRSLLDDINLLLGLEDGALPRAALAVFNDDAKLALEVEVAEPIASAGDVEMLLKEHGLEVVGERRLHRRLAAGVKLPLRRLLERLLCDADDVLVSEGSKLRVLSGIDAVKFWRR